MCGIHGFVDKQLTHDEGREIISSMIAKTKHRGPDNSNFSIQDSVYLGHNRLSIIDLSPESNQPMKMGSFTLVFNGEIYNYKEIREVLKEFGCVFTTNSDTEVILRAYQIWGKDCAQRFLGMWAFAIYDAQKEVLFCSRDRFGIKPFFYILQGDKFYFSSEVKALKETPVFSSDLNIEQVSRSLQLGWAMYKQETIYQKVVTLKPGHHLTYKKGRIQIESYYEIAKNRYDFQGREEAVDKFRQLFDDSIRLHLRSDVPLAATLSGGIDSSSIVCDILQNGKVENLKTYSVFYTGKDSVDERHFIDEVKTAYPGKFEAIYYSPRPEEVIQNFHSIVEVSDFPLLGSSQISHYMIMKRIAEDGIKVILSGQGADDYLGGYMHSFYRLYADQIRAMKLGSLVKNLSIHSTEQGLSMLDLMKVVGKSGLSSVFSENQLYELEYKKYYSHLIPATRSSKLQLEKWKDMNKFENFHATLLNYSSLPSILHHEDRNSMAASVETRVPFMDHRLVDVAFSIPNDYKIYKGTTKWILREAMKDVLPKAILERKDKKGFVTPGELLWLRNSMKHLLEIDYSKMDYLDKKICEQEIKDYKNGKTANAKLVWRLANLNYWVKHFN